jgi:hypothetical protein
MPAGCAPRFTMTSVTLQDVLDAVRQIELPGGSGSGSGEPPHELTVAEYARAAAGWLCT